MSNALGTITPVREIVRRAKDAGAKVLIDGSQAVVHIPVDVQALDCDFYVFTGHKLYGPSGIGVLYGREELLDAMPPYMGGGDMISRSEEHTSELQSLMRISYAVFFLKKKKYEHTAIVSITNIVSRFLYL